MSRYKQEDGAVAVIVTISLIVLMGIAALAVDAGRGYIERSNAQNAADHAALSAAWAECQDKTPAQAEAAGRQAAARNGYSGSSVKLTRSGKKWTADIDSQVQTTFGRVLGSDRLDVGARAVGECEPGTTEGNPYALYASGSACASAKTIEWSGNETEIYGDVHSDGSIDVSGNDNIVEGLGTYVTAFPGNKVLNPDHVKWDPSDNNPTQIASPKGTWPVPYDIEHYKPGGLYDQDPTVAYFDFGSDKIEGTTLCSKGYCESPNRLKPGIYHTSGEIIMKASGMQGNVTMVTSGNKHIEFEEQNLTPYHNDLLAFSNWHAAGTGGCGNEGIRVKNSNKKLFGVLFAPGSGVQWDGFNSELEGSVVALRIKINGNEHIIRAGEGGVGSDPHVYLLH
jgi:Flp pilus assembly protein TadG